MENTIPEGKQQQAEGIRQKITCNELEFFARISLWVELWVAAVSDLADETGRESHQIPADQDTRAVLQRDLLCLLLGNFKIERENC